MFNQKEYINQYIKEKYKTIKIRIKYEDQDILNKINSVDNVNKYLVDLIKEDINNTKKYNFINDKIEINFPLTKQMKYLIDIAEQADLDNNYAVYANYIDAIDVQAKHEVKYHIITESNWNRLLRRYVS